MGMAKAFPAMNKLWKKAIPAQSVSTITTIDGTQIDEPWKLGRLLSFLWIFGAFAGTSSGRAYIQGKKRSDGTWETIKDSAGNDWEILQTKLDDAAALEADVALCGVDLSQIDSATYSALRPRFSNEVAVAMLIACGYLIEDLYRLPSGQTDETRDIQKVL